MDATAIILAAGEGTRMKSNHCKVSHKILGKPMVQWIVDATIKAGCSRVVVVIGSHADEMRALIDGAYALTSSATLATTSSIATSSRSPVERSLSSTVPFLRPRLPKTT